ncbi:MAG: hypothetical protein GYA50_02075 [Eubacteriaceae bacterium]|nr:hypothetical protein [Eubacteriaceae bacterium]
MYHQDWLMSQIEGMVLMIVRLLFKKETSVYEIKNEANLTDTDLLYLKLIQLLNNNKINEAENLLFEKMDDADLNYMKIALDFYDRVNRLSDAQLEKNGFSREEIKSGLQDAARLFGINLNNEL